MVNFARLTSCCNELRITFVISSLGNGGAERVISTMANYWTEKEMLITLITLDTNETDFYRLHPNIKRIGLGLISISDNIYKTIINNIKRITKLRNAIECSSPDIVISFMDKNNVLTLLATRGLGLKVIVSERSDPVQNLTNRSWRWLRRVVYPWADMIVAQNQQVKQWLEEIFAGTKVVVIPNPIKLENAETESVSLHEVVGRKENIRSVVAMGRLGVEKGFDILIKAFAEVVHANTQWQLIIFGEGEERHALEQLISKLNLSERVYLPGRVTNPMRFLKQADLFVMSSRFEGFPNSLLEAMACGLPVVSFDCPSGPRAIIRDGVDGMLVPPENIEALVDAMTTLMSDEFERKRLSERGPEVLERFALEKIMTMWEDALGTILEKE